MGTQAEWNTYAANVANQWNLCANCEVSQGGKKLFRQYNFNRSLVGLGRIDTPVDDTEVVDQGGIAFQIYLTAFGAPAGLFINTTFPAPVWIVAQAGKALGNPLIHFVPGDEFRFYLSTDPTFIWFDNLKTIPSLVGCAFSDTGAPGFRIGIGIVVIP